MHGFLHAVRRGRTSLYRLVCLLAVLGVLASPAARAALCSDVFPQDATSSAVSRLDLSIMAGQSYQPFPTTGALYTRSQDLFYLGGKLANGQTIAVTPGKPVRIFIEGDLELAPQTLINPDGSASDLLIVVRGNLTIGTKNDINALIYVTGNIEANPDAFVYGALTAEGAVGTKVKDEVEYDAVAAAQFASGGLCTLPGDSSVDHFELVFATPTLSCAAIAVQVRACADPSCSATVELTDSITLAPADRWIGGPTRTFAGSGSLLAYMTRTAGDIVLGVANQRYSCSPADCRMQIRDSGFRIEIPSLTANRPSRLGSEQAYIQAVRKDDKSEACVAANGFAGQAKALRLWSTYSDPAAGATPVSIGGNPIGSSQPDATWLTLNFDQQARAAIDVHYADAGQMRLNALYTGSGDEEGLEMQTIAGSGLFVSRPAGFCITPQQTCMAGDSSCSAFRKVGETFSASIRPVAWESGADSDLCTGNRTTPNYRQSGLQLAPLLVQPAAGDSGTLLAPAARAYDHLPPEGASDWNGELSLDIAFSEVGVFRLDVTPPPLQYFGTTVPGSSSAPIGRFYPTHLQVEGEAALKPACSLFSYQDQPIEVQTAPSLTIRGQGRLPDGQVYTTKNYDFDGFWRLASRPNELWLAREQDRDIADRLRFDGAVEVIDQRGDGERTYRWMGDHLLYERSEAPDLADLPFSIRQRFSAAELTDWDGVCFVGEGDCQVFDLDFAGSQIRLGRVRAENAITSGLGDARVARLPLRLEHWGAGGFAVAGDDCTQAASEIASYSSNLTGAEVIRQADLAEERDEVQIRASGPDSLKGSASVRHLLAVQGSSAAPTWLCREGAPTQGGVCTFGRNADGSVREARADATATFGLFEGRAPLIFLREVYR